LFDVTRKSATCPKKYPTTNQNVKILNHVSKTLCLELKHCFLTIYSKLYTYNLDPKALVKGIENFGPSYSKLWSFYRIILPWAKLHKNNKLKNNYTRNKNFETNILKFFTYSL
jgi:hypothetical protein